MGKEVGGGERVGREGGGSGGEGGREERKGALVVASFSGDNL